MRILFTCTNGYGSLHPLLRLALRAQAAGHEVAIATAEGMRGSVERQGITFYEMGGEMPFAVLYERYPDLIGLQGPEAFARRRELLFADIRVELTLPDMVELCKAWQPDVLVRGHIELVGCLAAEELGIPHVVVEEHASGNLATLPQVVSKSLSKWRGLRNLAPDPEMLMLERYLTLVPFPPSLRHSSASFGSNAHRIQPLIFSESGGEQLPDWMDRLPAQPVAHAALTTLDRPDTLARGDQPDNAACAAAAGAGRVITPTSLTPETIREATLDVLSNPAYRRSVESLRQEIAALPPVEEVLTLIELVARDQMPLPRSA